MTPPTPATSNSSPATTTSSAERGRSKKRTTAAGDLRVRLEQIQKRGRRKDVVAHRGVDPAGIPGHGRCIGLLFVKGHDASFLVRFNDSEFGSVLPRNGNRRNRHVRVPSYVEVDHAGDVHAIDMVPAEDGHHVH